VPAVGSAPVRDGSVELPAISTARLICESPRGMRRAIPGADTDQCRVDKTLIPHPIRAVVRVS
jgi:hypothetical protein